MNYLKRSVVILLALVLNACPYPFWPDDYEFEYDIIVTDVPVNLVSINSSYDDYNSDLPYPYTGKELYFSSNRSGHDFNIILRDLSISYHEKDDVLNVHCSYVGDYAELTSYQSELLELVNTYDDQLGPLFFFGPQEHSYFFYADNREGDFDIKFTHHLKSDFGTHSAQEVINGPDSLLVINSDKDDLYPSITPDQDKLYFCSDREGERFNIYSVPLPGAQSLHDFFTGSEAVEPDLNAVLSTSDFNDKCPYIYEDIMVFTSDREGGFGGFDLYFSLLVNGNWTAPVNFGPKINTEYDEYRPILFPFIDIQMNLMIFSSDRPGGLGGFDLYMVKADSYISPPAR